MVRPREQVRRHEDAVLAASEERFRAAFDALSDSLMLFSPILDESGAFAEAEIGWINRSARERWFGGAQLEELRGRRLFDLFPQVKPVVFDIYSDVVANGTDYRGVITLHHDELGDVILQVHVTPYQSGFIHSSRDITAAHEARLALQDSENRYRTVSESLSRRVEELDSLRRVSQILTDSGDGDGAALDRVAAEVRTLLAARCVRIHALTTAADPSGPPTPTLSGSAGAAECTDSEAELIHAALDDGKPTTSCPTQHGTDHHVAIPMLAGDRVVGVLIASREAKAFSTREIGIASTTADLLAAAVQSATIHEIEKQQAASGERQRLARDLHDAVSQSIYSASLIAEVLPSVWSRSPEEGEHDLATMRHLVRNALAELRTLLYELQPSTLEAASLATLLERLGESFTGRTDIRLEIAAPDSLTLPLDVKTAFYRVAQEALNNVSKHARASVARVTATLDDDEVRLTVTDDGRGMAPGAARDETYGLGIMRDRAKDIGAVLEVTGAPGTGTTVVMTWIRSAAGTEAS